jgi:Cu2+-containing amine oxidase
MTELKGKGKFGALIQEARKPENQKTIEPEIVELENQKISKTHTQKQAEPVAIEAAEMVNLGIKVPKSWRQHWAAEAKRNGTTMTDVMTEALTAKFGLPD